jgi:hypothetical protein
VANTRYLTIQVEDYVRQRLEDVHGSTFSKQMLPLNTGGSHEFDAVSDDGRIVASIKAASGRTKTGKYPSGKVNGCLAELYYLSLVDATTRILILTAPGFHEILVKKVEGALAPGISIELIQLPSGMQVDVDRVVAEASREVSPLAAQEVVEEEIT